MKTLSHACHMFVPMAGPSLAVGEPSYRTLNSKPSLAAVSCVPPFFRRCCVHVAWSCFFGVQTTFSSFPALRVSVATVHFFVDRLRIRVVGREEAVSVMVSMSVQKVGINSEALALARRMHFV